MESDENNKRIKSDEQPFVCSHTPCDKRFSKAQYLRQHERFSHTGSFLYCPDCKHKTRSKGNLRQHAKVHMQNPPKPYNCRSVECKRSFRFSADCTRHELTHLVDRPTFACTLCSSTHKSLNGLKIHQQIHNPDRQRNHPCPYDNCNNSFYSSADLKNHLEIHNENRSRDYKCPECDVKCFSIGELKSHQLTHLDDSSKPYQCLHENCKSGFNSSSQLKIHLLKHIGDPSYTCKVDGCKSGFYTTAELERHQQIHDPNRKREFHCLESGCGKSFYTSDVLKDHQRRIHDPTYQKTHRCRVEGCTWSFFTASALKSHETTHLEHREHECPEPNCNWTATTERSLTLHMKIHSTRERKFNCSYNNCDYSSYDENTLRHHLPTHLDEKPFKCEIEWCPYKCSQKGTIKRHMKVHSVQGQLRRKVKEEAVARALEKEGINFKREQFITMSCFQGTNVRVDFLIVEKGRIIMIEVDEHQHEQYPISCDSVRPWKIAESLMVEGNTLPLTVIRMNPDMFRIGDKVQKIPKAERYRALVDKVKGYIDSEEEVPPLRVEYMYYDRDAEGCLTILNSDEFYEPTKEVIVNGGP